MKEDKDNKGDKETTEEMKGEVISDNLENLVLYMREETLEIDVNND
jgi:hypothetical protein